MVNMNQKTPLNSYGEMTMDDFNDVMTSLGTPLKHFVYTTTTYSQEPIVILTGLTPSKILTDLVTLFLSVDPSGLCRSVIENLYSSTFGGVDVNT